MGLKFLGYQTKINNFSLLAIGFGKINVAYDCLGFGVMSFLAAFTITFPAKMKMKCWLFISSIIVFQLLNILRLMLLALYWKGNITGKIDHHTVFNTIIYVLIFIGIYIWIEKSTIKEASV